MLQLRVGDPDQEGGGQHEAVVGPHLQQVGHQTAIQRLAVDHELDPGDQRHGAHADALGTVSVRPRGSASGSSMSLASAISRQRVASPYMA